MKSSGPHVISQGRTRPVTTSVSVNVVAPTVHVGCALTFCVQDIVAIAAIAIKNRFIFLNLA
jgi:hypothetical protein